MRKKLFALSLCLSLLISSAVILFPRVSAAETWSWSNPPIAPSVPLGPSSMTITHYSTDTAKIERGNVCTTIKCSDERIYNETPECMYRYNPDGSLKRTDIIEGCHYDNTIIGETKTVITIYETIQIKWKDSKTVEYVHTTSGKKEIFYYYYSNPDWDRSECSWNWNSNCSMELINYFYEPIPARSFTFPLELNSRIIALGGPNCIYSYHDHWRKGTRVDTSCDTYGLSTDGRVGSAHLQYDGSWSNPFAISLPSLGLFFDNADFSAIFTPSSYGTVENSNSLGVGNWTWSGFWNNTNTGFIIPPPPTVNLQTPDTYSISKPDNKTLIGLGWNSTNADSCIASGDWSGNKSINGTESVSKPRGNYTFNLSCSGTGGSASDSVVVNVIQVPKCNLSADPASITLPQTSTLSWFCDYADSCSINQGIGSVSNVSGSKVIRPDKTTNYTLTCNGLDGSRSVNVDVNIGFIPRIKEVNPGAWY